MPASRQNISSDGPWEARVGYSRAVRVGPHIYVSGCTAMTPAGVVGKADPYAQARQALATIQRALEQAGASMAHVVRTRIFVVDMRAWPEVARAHGEAFAAVLPAATMVQVAALIDPELLVEIEADAYAPGPPEVRDDGPR
ncbi:MAG: RidA family protein [Thermoanaerobaculia bacterium]